MQVEFVNAATGVHPVFYPILNSSQAKEFTAEKLMELASTLKSLNEQGFELKSIHRIMDDKMLGYQVAIFTKEIVSQ